MAQEQQHPISPPSKLVGDWLTEAADLHLLIPSNLHYLATRAAQWGADQEMEALLVWLRVKGFVFLASDLLAARRPKPPSLKEQALEVLKSRDLMQPLLDGRRILQPDELDTILRAVEALP
jgi:hypothetical protein